MKNVYKNEQTGRSMVEMLGVLAIIGVLSVAGIAGYSKAMAKFKQGKVMDQVSMVVSNIRTLFAGQRDFSSLPTTNAHQVLFNMGVIPDEMVQGTNTETGVTAIRNALGGTVTVIPITSYSGRTNGAFVITFGGLSRDACVNMLVSDWGSGGASGLEVIRAGAAATAPTTHTPVTAAATGTGGVWTTASLPVSPVAAASTCACGASPTCWVAWQYN